MRHLISINSITLFTWHYACGYQKPLACQLTQRWWTLFFLDYLIIDEMIKINSMVHIKSIDKFNKLILVIHSNHVEHITERLSSFFDERLRLFISHHLILIIRVQRWVEEDSKMIREHYGARSMDGLHSYAKKYT